MICLALLQLNASSSRADCTGLCSLHVYTNVYKTTENKKKCMICCRCCHLTN